MDFSSAEDGLLKTGEINKITSYLDDLDLTIRMRKFCFYYCHNGLDGSLAAMQAGYTVSKKNKESKRGGTQISVQARKNLQKPKIKEAIKRILQESLGISKDSLEKKLYDTYYRRAFYDISTFQEADGTWKKTSKVPKKWRPVIDGVEKKYYGKDCQRGVVITKLADRDLALKQLAKYIEMISTRLDVKFTGISSEAKEKLKDIFMEKEEDTNKK